MATLSSAGMPRSRFWELPTPAIPTKARLSAVLAGAGLGVSFDDSDVTAIALATAAGDTATGPERVLRRGVLEGAAVASIVGTDDTEARRVDARATCISVPDEGASTADAVGFVVSTRLACRAIVDADGLSNGCDDSVGARVATTAEADVDMFGRTVARVRRVFTGVRI